MGRPVDLYDVRKVDAALGATLEKLAAAAAGGSSSGGASKGAAAAVPMLVDGCPLEDLCLSFVLPGKHATGRMIPLGSSPGSDEG